MPDRTTQPELPAAITDEPQAAAMQPDEGEQLVRKTTHEVETNDMGVLARTDIGEIKPHLDEPGSKRRVVEGDGRHQVFRTGGRSVVLSVGGDG